MTEFKIQVALLRALVEASFSQIEGDDGKRYLAGFLFGLGAAEEVSQFDPWPAEVPAILWEDLFLRGSFDGRAGNTREWLKAKFRR